LPHTSPRSTSSTPTRSSRPFTEDAYVNDNRREIAGIAAIRRWVSLAIIFDQSFEY
jgi:hypothetical protein